MLQDQSIRRPGLNLLSLGAIVAIAIVTVLGAMFVRVLPAVSLADGTVPILLDAALFFIILCVVVGTAMVHKVDTRRLVYRCALTIWWMLLVDEVFFARVNTGYGMGAGQFSLYAYAEAAMWLVCWVILLVLTLRSPGYLTQFFKGSAKWLSFFVMLCLISIAWAPGPLYALAWSVKLVLAVSLLTLCSSLIEDLDDIMLFFKVTAFAFLFLTVLPVYYATQDPDGFFFEGRLNADPDLLGPLAASLMLMSMLLYSATKKRYWAVSACVGAFVMLLAFGKAGVIGGFLGALLFMVLQRKVVRSLGMMIGLGGLALIIMSLTPLGGYIESYHGGSTLTGRTVIWGYAMNAIKQKPILGYGYLGTYFSWMNISGLVAGAVHLHNGFLEVAYNNGIVGEILLLTVHFVMVRNILSSMLTSRTLRALEPNSEQAWHGYLITIACLALYVHTFLQGLLGGHFGGRCMSPYMLWLALTMVSAMVRKAKESMLEQATHGKAPLFTQASFISLNMEPVTQN
jgi:O-antigen ligase